MDHDEDVERLFSWIKTPDLRYREFAGARDVSDAVASWPVLRKTAAETGRPDGMPATQHEITPAEATPPEVVPARPRPPARNPLGERLRSVFARREPLPPAEPVFHEERVTPPAPERTGEVPWAQVPPGAPPPVFTHPEPAPPPSAEPGEREEALGDAYRGFEEDGAQPPPPPVEDHPRSLDAVFSRLARPARNYRDERQRAAGGSGLGPVFRRLR